MKKLFLLLFVLLASGPNKTKTFKENINKGYESYYLEDFSVNEEYTFIVAVGKEGKNINYSVAFSSYEAGEYQLEYKTQDESFIAPCDGRGDVFLYGIKGDNITELVVCVNAEEKKTFLLKEYSVEMYELFKDRTEGEGKGLFRHDTLSYKRPSQPTFVLSSIFVFVILCAVIVILVTYVRKKGVFAGKEPDPDVEKVRKFIRDFKNIPQDVPDAVYVESEVKDVAEEENSKEESPALKKVEVYKKLHDDDDEYDISLKLKEKGIPQDYGKLTVDDKKSVMIELMRMRDMKEITEDEYKAEVIRLWM